MSGQAITADDFVSILINVLRMGEDEKARLEAIFSGARQYLMKTLPYVKDVIQMGSLTRGTCLPSWTGSTPDIDIIIAVDEASFNMGVEKGDLELIQRRIADDLKPVATYIQLLADPPFLMFNFCDVKFDCVVSSINFPDNIILFKRASEWERKNYHLLNRYWGTTITAGKPWWHLSALNPFSRPSAPKEFAVLSTPFMYNQWLSQLSDDYGSGCRDLVLLWKFSRHMLGSNLTSYMIEHAVFQTAAKPDWLGEGSKTPLRAAAALFCYPAVRRDSLLNKDDAFKSLRDAITQANKLSTRSQHKEAVELLQTVFPLDVHSYSNGEAVYSLLRAPAQPQRSAL